MLDWVDANFAQPAVDDPVLVRYTLDGQNSAYFILTFRKFWIAFNQEAPAPAHWCYITPPKGCKTNQEIGVSGDKCKGCGIPMISCAISICCGNCGRLNHPKPRRNTKRLVS